MPPTVNADKKKRLLIAAGIFLIPALILVIAIFALTRSHKNPPQKIATGSAFNTDMPTPNLPKKEENKLEAYMKAEQDSIKQSQDRQKDPYSQNTQAPPSGAASTGRPAPGMSLLPTTPSAGPRPGVVTSPFADENDKKVTDGLDRLYAALGKGRPATVEPASVPSQSAYGLSDQSPEIAKLEKIMQAYQKSDTATNPQLAQVKQVLDEIKEIQNPQHQQQGTSALEAGFKPLPVGTHPDPLPDTGNWPVQAPTQNTFFGLADDPDSSTNIAGSIQAVIHADQTVQTGSIVKLRLLQPIYVGNVQIPANAFIYGPASISGERVAVQLTNAIYDGRIYPISMKVYDGIDGLEGLYVPGMITRDVVKQNMSQGVSGMSIGTLDPSLGAQAAAATIETARNLLSRKIAIVKATLKAGDLAILKSTSAGLH